MASPGARSASARPRPLLARREPAWRPPWRTIWSDPRLAVRQAARGDAARLVIVVAWLAGTLDILQHAATRQALPVNTGWAVLLVAWAVGPLAGFAYFAVTGAVLASVGRALGGSADVSDTRTALACSMLPEVAALPLWIPVLAYYGLAIFTKAQDGWPHGMIAFGVLQALLYLWSLVLRLITLAEVHAFSIGRALGTLLVGWLAGVAMLLALGLALAGVIAVLGR